jgi:hypothetical protein
MTTTVDPPTERTEARRPRRLGRTAHKAALLSHVLSSVGWFGAALLVAFCGLVSTSADPAFAHALYRTMDAAIWLTIPLGLLAVATGVVLSLGTKWGLVRYKWVVAKIAISVAVIVTDALVIASAAHDAVVSGVASPQLRDGAIAHCVVLGVATYLSVFKPFGKTPRGRRASVPTR